MGYFAGVQVYNLQVANLQGTEYSYYSNAAGATLMQGLHYQVAPQWHFMGGFLLSSARMQYKTDDEVRVANTPTSALLSRGFAPFFQYQHPWSDSVKTQADIALNPSDPASVAQWGLKLLLELAGFEVNGEFDDVKTLGGRQIMAGIQGIKRYEGTEYSDGKLKNKVSVRLGTITRTRDETVALPIALQPVQSGFYATSELWHNWLIGGLSFVENVGPGARLGVGTETDKATYVVTAQYKYLMTDIYGARVDTFSLYFSVLAKNLF